MGEPNEGDGSITVSTTLNDLPEHLLLRILTFLPTLDAIQTTLISCKWQNLWTSLPSLSFDYALFPPYDSPSETLRSFADFIYRTLILRSPSDLLKLRLRFPSAPEIHRYQSHIDSYVRYAVDHNAKHLDLNFHSKYRRSFEGPEKDTVYDFPLSVLRNSSVRGLLLERCNVILPINASRSMRFEALTLLFLEQVYLTDEMVTDLVSGCFNLEYLTIIRCHGMKNVKISSSKLKDLGLWDFRSDEGSVEVSAPNLRKLNILFFEVGNYVVQDASAQLDANICFIHKSENYGYWSKVTRLLGNVKRLSTQNWGFKLVAAKDFSSGSFLFYNLNYLELMTGYSKSDLLGIAALLELSPNLETMVLEPLLKLDEEMFEEIKSEEFEVINFSMPSLKKLKIKCYRGAEDASYFLNLVLKNEVVLERIILVPVRMGKTSVTPIVMEKQAQGFQVLLGSSPV